MNIGLAIVALIVFLALVGLAVISEQRKRHGASPLTGSAFQRRADSYTPAQYYNQQSKNPWVVDPHKEEAADNQSASTKSQRDEGQ